VDARRTRNGLTGVRTRIPVGEIPALKIIQQGVSIDPFERLRLETTTDEVSTRALDLIAPIGRGQRCLIVAPPMAGKTTLLIQTANAIAQNHPDVRTYILLVDERPEEVTHFRRSTTAEVHAASSDMSAVEHIQIAEACMNKALEHVVQGEDVLLLLDSITRLARAYNTVTMSGGRTLSGGLDATTMLVPRQIFGAARKIEDGGSLTIMGTSLIDTGSRMDEVIFQEFKGTGNMELFLSRELFTKRIFPCIDIEKSGTRKEEKLTPPEDLAKIYLLRRHMSAMKAPEAMSFLLELLSRYSTNEELLSSLVTKR
jgi:transcription termination factor Rho